MSPNEQTIKQDNKIYKNILSILVVLIIALTISDIIVFFTSKTNSEPDTSSSTDNHEESSNNNIFSMDLDSLTKEQTIEAFREMQKPGYIPEGFASPDLAVGDKATIIVLDYSYESVDEITQKNTSEAEAEGDRLQGLNDEEKTLDISTVGDYYVVTTTDYRDGIHQNGAIKKAVSFNKKYVNYYKETIDNHSNDKAIFTDTSPEAVQITLPVFSMHGTMTQPDSIFSYNLAEENDKYVLTLYCIGISIDFMEYSYNYSKTKKEPNSITDMPYTITHYTVTISLDKNTGIPDWNRGEDGSVSNLVQSYRLNEEEIESLSEYLIQG